jgi:molybdopterin/thiamine biosynthesis adenylyltransferase
MEDHLDLFEYYKNVADEIRHYLHSNYDASEIKPSYIDQEKYPITFSFPAKVVENEIELRISIPFNFPDSFPKASIGEENLKEIYPIPHLSRGNDLCLFDTVQAIPNQEYPIGVLEATIDKARDLLEKGITGVNNEDYIDEFYNYWSEESKENYLSIVKPSEFPKEVFLIPFKHKGWIYQGIFSDSKSSALNWIKHLGGKTEDDKTHKSLYIPLKHLLTPPFPIDNKNIYDLLKSDKQVLKSLLKFLSKYKRPTHVLFSMSFGEEFGWGAWTHQVPSKTDVLKYKGRKRIQTALKGFREGTQNPILELVRDFPKSEVQKHSVENIQRERLIIRGGSGKLDHNNFRVTVTGCGSVGSHLAQSLADMKVSEMLLIDSDLLTFENINRHLCGATDVLMPKVKAIKEKLRKHDPFLDIQTYKGDILKLLTIYPKILNSYDFNIVAIGNLPVELRLNNLQLINKIKKPILYVWVEPFLAGGHAVWINPNDKGCLRCLFDENGKYKYEVLKHGDSFTKRELGCNTSYVPYGISELKKFIIDLIFFLQENVKGRLQHSEVFTWLGNLDEQRKQGRLLNSNWIAAKSFSIRKRSLTKVHGCVQCNDL